MNSKPQQSKSEKIQSRKIPLTILVVDDDDLVRKTLKKILIQLGYNTIEVGNPAAAIEVSCKEHIDIALLDYQLPNMSGTELMIRLQEQLPDLLSIIITGYGTIERAVEAMQNGAWDFLSKPITTNMLREKLTRIEEFCFLRQEHDFHSKVIQQDFKFPGVIGPSAAMQFVYEAILRAAQSTLPILIEGETGSGKEHIAEAIHLNSRRKSKPFVILDCTATPQSLIESMLFGSLKGAFTGAIERKGLLKEAEGGTLFLDEIGEINLEIQPKLLRCLETKRFRPVGGSKEIESDFRIICATNQDLKAETNTGNFRTDLFYRISAQKIYVPSLRERPADISVFARHFLDEIAVQNNHQDIEFSLEAIHMLKTYSWPGNVRQLKFVIESAFYNASGKYITPEQLNLDDSTTDKTADRAAVSVFDFERDFKSFREGAVQEAERAYVRSLLEKTGGDVRQAAKKAKLTREALYRIMSRCGLSPGEFRKKDTTK